MIHTARWRSHAESRLSPEPALAVKAGTEPELDDPTAVQELNSPQLFGDDGGDFMAALSMRDPEPQPAPQPAYRPAPQPAPVYQPTAQPTHQLAPQSASQPVAQPEQVVDPITQKLGFAVAQPAAAPAQPNTWRELRDTKGRTYYFNKVTKKSVWTKPPELMSAIERADSSTKWKEHTTADGRKCVRSPTD